jgi:ferredoxin, 2Fe-2S
MPRVACRSSTFLILSPLTIVTAADIGIMGRVTYIEHNGKSHTIELADGVSLMEGAVSNGVPGIDADCGGSCACATCHVHVDSAWLTAVGPTASEAEGELLQLAPEVAADSRLSCQIKMRPELDGVVVRMPEAQH